ncbi:Rhodanese- sulfurtransferase [Sorochytrium milnesiophthora]
MDVTKQLEAHKAQFKPVTVKRLMPYAFDVANLSIVDPNPLDVKKLQSSTEQFLHDLSRDSAQVILNELFSLPTTANDEGVIVNLVPPPSVSGSDNTAAVPGGAITSPTASVVTYVKPTTLPREKSLPKDRPMTKWERFAKEKGIQNRKRGRMVYDEATGEYRPRWGYGSAKNDALNDWLIEVPQNGDPFEDQYAKRREEKKERVSKNQKQQARNAGEAVDVARANSDARTARRTELDTRIRASKMATASMGKFDQTIKGDVRVNVKGAKRKFDAGDNVGEEKARERDLAMRVLNKADRDQGAVNKNKAANKFGVMAERENTSKRAQAELRRQEKRGGSKKQRRA